MKKFLKILKLVTSLLHICLMVILIKELAEKAFDPEEE